MIINTETRSIDVTKKGVYFAFRDQGACLSLLAVKVYYLTCPEITVGFAHYPETATGAEVSSIEKVLGKCTDHSVAVSQPSYLCKGDGSWIYNTGQCACMAGYEADEASQTCEACPVGRFKVRIIKNNHFCYRYLCFLSLNNIDLYNRIILIMYL